MLNEINAGVEAVKAFYNGYKRMEDFGQRMSEASNKEEMLTICAVRPCSLGRGYKAQKSPLLV
jgi:hypothetical protein